jgi:hypothetical protein
VHELSLLSAHLKCNLRIDGKYDIVSFDEALSVHLDLAMAVRREGIPGARTPEGILTKLQGTPLGSIIAGIEARPDPATIDFGLQILALDDESIKTTNKCIEYILAQSARDRKNHNFTTAFGESSSGLTVHCNCRSKREATDSLLRHCTLRKYSQKALSWFGLVLSPTDGSVRFGIKLEGDWKQDPLMEKAVQRMPVGMRLAKVNGALTAKRVGRNDLCPCGSGRKYKKCCLVKL